MFLQLTTLLFAVQWLGSPYQLGALKAVFACILFLFIILVSTIPSFLREWRNYLKYIIISLLIQLVCLALNFLLPGLGLVITIIYNIVLIIVSRFIPVSFIQNMGIGFILFLLWFAGINHFLGNFILKDPRGVWSGDLYFTFTDWVILATFIAAFARTVYHIKLNFMEQASKNRIEADEPLIKPEKNKFAGLFNKGFGISKNILSKNAQNVNKNLMARENKTLIPVFLISVFILIISALIPPLWQRRAVNDLRTGFTAAANNDYSTARVIAEKYYNDKKILYNGDVFFLNGLVEEKESPQAAIKFFTKAGDWYEHHKSWISQSYRGESYYRLTVLYLNSEPPDYYRAKNAIAKAVKHDPEKTEYIALQSQIKENLEKHEKDGITGFFKRLWNNFRSRF